MLSISYVVPTDGIRAEIFLLAAFYIFQKCYFQVAHKPSPSGPWRLAACYQPFMIGCSTDIGLMSSSLLPMMYCHLGTLVSAERNRPESQSQLFQKGH